MTLYNLFTGRALRNIELILDEIYQLPLKDRLPMLLSLTAASGQMSRMVFAIKNRKKNIEKNIDKTEVGSWVVGFWRPKIHFEINVWNCFERRVKKLIKAAKKVHFPGYTNIAENPTDVINGKSGICLLNDDCLEIINKFPHNSIDLILTDPPPSDRIPYLELSNMWNIIIKKEANFQREIGVSNAKNRNKDKNKYTEDMINFFKLSSLVLKDSGILALMFNARDKTSWHYFEELINKESIFSLKYIGYFPVKYSAGSVIQDTRKGSLRDLVLIFSKNDTIGKIQKMKLSGIAGWSEKIPVKALKSGKDK